MTTLDVKKNPELIICHDDGYDSKKHIDSEYPSQNCAEEVTKY